MKYKLEHDALKYSEEHDGTNFLMVEGQMEVCPTCGGTGAMERRDLDMSLVTDSMLEDGDYEAYEHYMKGGYDVPCDHCRGKNVVFEANWELVPEWARDAIEDWEESRRESDRISAQERAMGA